MNGQQSDGWYTLTPQEMVKKRRLLRVKEAAYCLNVSERHVYDLIAEGKLAALKNKPIRIKVEDVALMMNDFDALLSG
jgi:excisionase family DNA binding protein